MATRKQLWHPDAVREKIQASQLINRLMSHVLSDTPIMDSSQVTAAAKLLNKVLPDLSAVTLGGDKDNPLNVGGPTIIFTGAPAGTSPPEAVGGFKQPGD